jgi:D-lactate dehydrogenase (cytochrome)
MSRQMIIKTSKDQVAAYLSDASYMRGGQAERVVFPETPEEVAAILRQATSDRTPVTVSGAGTGTVGGRIASGGIVLATDKLNRIRSIAHKQNGGGIAVAEAGVVLADFQRAVEAEGLLYPPDPTERSCFLGGTVATNASGARTFKYGPTRKYVRRAKLVLATGELFDLRRGEMTADRQRAIEVSLPGGRQVKAKLPSYEMPQTRKNATAYFAKPEMDLLDLFIGSEGTLAVIVEVETDLLSKPQALLSGVVFFSSASDVLSFVAEARTQSLQTRATSNAGLDARALEYFDRESLIFLRQKYPTIPENAAGAVFFEQETTSETEDSVMSAWWKLLENHQALSESWFATNEQDQTQLREFRHQLPVLMNEWFARYGQKKVSTDMAVPDAAFPSMLSLYQDTLRSSNLRYTIFGHIGDSHIHVNILPRDDDEGARARDLYVQFLKYAASVGGTLSAEHGVGKLKRDYLRLFFSEQHLREMAALKLAFDPAGILGRGNIFSESLLDQ